MEGVSVAIELHFELPVPGNVSWGASAILPALVTVEGVGHRLLECDEIPELYQSSAREHRFMNSRHQPDHFLVDRGR